MPDSLKSSRQIPKSRVLIIVFILVFIAGYSTSQLGPAKALTTTRVQTRTVDATTTVTKLNPGYAISTAPQFTESVVSSTSTFVTIVNSSTLTSTQFILTTTTIPVSSSTTSSATITYSGVTTSSSSTTTSSTSTNSTLPTTGVIFAISQSKLRNIFNLTSNSISFVPSSTNVSYYIITRANSTIGLLYLTTDVALGSCWGYNGYIETLALVNTTGFIKYLYVYSNPDSYVYMITQRWLNTYINRSVFEPLVFGQDAQPVTGATYSSAGIVDGVRDAGRIVVDNYEAQQNVSASNRASVLVLGAVLGMFGSIENSNFLTQVLLITLICAFAAAVIAFKLRSEKWLILARTGTAHASREDVPRAVDG